MRILKAENFPGLKRSLSNSWWPHWLEKLINYLNETSSKLHKQAHKKIEINNDEINSEIKEAAINAINNNEEELEAHNSWQTNKESIAGSWWPHWLEWLAKHSGEKTPPPIATAQDIIEAAPGSYVRRRIDS